MEEKPINDYLPSSAQDDRTNRLDDIVKEQMGQWDFKKRGKISESTEQPKLTTPSVPTESTEPTRRTSSKQRKASLDEYREQFLRTPKITDRQPVFISRTTRDCIDDIVRRLGERRMSVSGFLENLANHHLELYAEEVEQWKRL